MHDLLEFTTVNAPLIAVLAVILVVIPTLIVFGAEGWKQWLEHREAMAGALNAQAAEKAAQYAAHTQRLEQRMRVLERIVTDRGLDVADEIERLRVATPLD